MKKYDSILKSNSVSEPDRAVNLKDRSAKRAPHSARSLRNPLAPEANPSTGQNIERILITFRPSILMEESMAVILGEALEKIYSDGKNNNPAVMKDSIDAVKETLANKEDKEFFTQGKRL